MADSTELLVQPDIGEDIDATAVTDNAGTDEAASLELFIEIGTGASLKDES